MEVKIMNPEELTLKSLVKHRGELYTIRVVNGKPIFGPISLDKIDEDMCVLRIVDAYMESEVEPAEELPTKVCYGAKRREQLTYKYDGTDTSGNIHVKFRSESGGIRISFNDKESAEAYFDYFREQFYTHTTGASVITVSNIYDDLHVVNYDKEACNDWGWYTLDGGTCRYISSYVTKDKDAKRYGFTLKRPTRLYESKRKTA